MTNTEFVDTHVDDLRDKLPFLLRQHPRAIAFLRAFSDRAEPIVEAAADVGRGGGGVCESTHCRGSDRVRSRDGASRGLTSTAGTSPGA